MIKKALILAGGKGKRLGQYTNDRPKCLIEVGGKSFLEYQLEALEKNEIKDVIIVTGYKDEKVREFIRNSKFINLKIKLIKNVNFDSTNSSYGFWLAKDEIKNEPYIHLNCDILFSPCLLKKLIESKYNDVIVIDKKIKLKDNMEQVYMHGDKIIHMQNTLLKDAVGKAIGIAKFSSKNILWIKKKTEEYINNGDKNKNHYGIIREAIKYMNFFGLDPEEENIFEVNSLEDLNKINEDLKKQSK